MPRAPLNSAAVSVMADAASDRFGGAAPITRSAAGVNTDESPVRRYRGAREWDEADAGIEPRETPANRLFD